MSKTEPFLKAINCVGMQFHEGQLHVGRIDTVVKRSGRNSRRFSEIFMSRSSGGVNEHNL